jgi:hypothetical protein
LAREFSGSENPAIGDSGFYYYVWAAARALRSAGAPALVSPEGTPLYWARQLTDGLLAKQETSGSWMNTGSDRWWEGDRMVATSFALLAIEAMMPSEDAGVRIRTPDGGVVRVLDPMGRMDAQIPGWSLSPDGTVNIDDASLGPFSVEVEGSGTVEIAPVVDGTVRIWREVGLQREGGSMTVDVAPLLGPAFLVVGNVGGLPAGPADPESPGLTAIMLMAAVVVVATVSAVAARTRRSR